MDHTHQISSKSDRTEVNQNGGRERSPPKGWSTLGTYYPFEYILKLNLNISYKINETHTQTINIGNQEGQISK